MSKTLALLLALTLTGCASPKKYEYKGDGPPNASLAYRGKTEVPFIKSVMLTVFKANGCTMEGLGAIMVNSSEQKFSIPVDAFLQVDAYFDSFSAISPYSTTSNTYYRFNSHKSEQYLFEVNDNGRSFGFQVFRVKANGAREEVPYVSVAKNCAR